MEGQIRTAKERVWARGTHVLESTKAGTNQDGKSKQTSERHSQTGEHGRRHNSGCRRKRAQARGTHTLGSTEGGTSEGSIRKREREGALTNWSA